MTAMESIFDKKDTGSGWADIFERDEAGVSAAPAAESEEAPAEGQEQEGGGEAAASKAAKSGSATGPLPAPEKAIVDQPFFDEAAADGITSFFERLDDEPFLSLCDEQAEDDAPTPTENGRPTGHEEPLPGTLGGEEQGDAPGDSGGVQERGQGAGRTISAKAILSGQRETMSAMGYIIADDEAEHLGGPEAEEVGEAAGGEEGGEEGQEAKPEPQEPPKKPEPGKPGKAGSVLEFYKKRMEEAGIKEIDTSRYSYEAEEEAPPATAEDDAPMQGPESAQMPIQGEGEALAPAVQGLGGGLAGRFLSKAKRAFAFTKRRGVKRLFTHTLSFLAGVILSLLLVYLAS